MLVYLPPLVHPPKGVLLVYTLVVPRNHTPTNLMFDYCAEIRSLYVSRYHSVTTATYLLTCSDILQIFVIYFDQKCEAGVGGARSYIIYT